MKQYKLFTGNQYKLFTGNFTANSVWLAPEHIISVAANNAGRGSIIRMSNGTQWAVTAEPEDVVADLEVKE